MGAQAGDGVQNKAMRIRGGGTASVSRGRYVCLFYTLVNFIATLGMLRGMLRIFNMLQYVEWLAVSNYILI